MKEELTMSKKERKRLKILSEQTGGKLKVQESAELLEISERQMYRIMEQGDAGVIHGLRGRKSNHGYSEAIKVKVLKIYWLKYRDFGPTLFSEKLEELEKIKIDHETVRRWMRENGIITNERKKRPHRKRRERRSAIGEMLQLDGSHHEWFEGRCPKCCLINIVDDASGRVFLRFSEEESTMGVMEALMPHPKDNVFVRRYLNGSLHIFNKSEEELTVKKLRARLTKRESNRNFPRENYPWRNHNA